jgi:hypothetical protein
MHLEYMDGWMIPMIPPKTLKYLLPIKDLKWSWVIVLHRSSCVGIASCPTFAPPLAFPYPKSGDDGL